MLWAFDKLFDFASTIASESGIVIIHGGEGFHSVNEDSGELLWEFTFEEFNKKYDTGAAPGRRGIRGPLINGIFYFTMAKDLLVAVDASNGELIWQYSLNMPFKAKAMIFKEGRLYFTVDHGFCSDNPLFCIDAETGEEIFKTEEYFTPKGCHNSVITDNYLIGGDGKYLSFFDLEKQEFIYRFKERKKRPIFGGVLYPYKNQLVTCSDKTLFWFKSKK